ncbi:MAG: filamentous hemagglutinin N-terminal domain-containing protein, partial [Methyloversatilis sp.]|uniref:two-partner secretion domain-containing protein n=1 Tax=Methyloversatilis sp. TaxID=2569862 RepID=UPI002732C9E5
MNKGRYRLVFSEEKGGYVPVPEETKARGKGGGARALRRVVAAMAAALPGLAIANPTGHQVVHGNVGVQVQGSTLNITASDKAIINWQQFSIQPGETTRFIQPGSTASVLNRVVGQDPSKILGNLIANGRVFLINPNGVLFGAGAKVDTAGLVASTLNIRNEDFLAGRMKFDADGNAGKLRNDGTLKTTGGPLILIATDVENTGLITAENGDIVLAAGKSVEIADPHQPSLRVRVEAGGEAINLGQLIAHGGSVGMFGAALTQAGKISATGAHRTEDGRIVLRGSKSVTLTAQSETVAQTADGAGGSIDISAPEVKVDAGALVDASGTSGGRIEVSAEQRATVEGTLRAVGRVDAPTAAVTPVPVAAPVPASVADDDLDLPVTAAGPAPAAPVSASAGQGGVIVVTADTVVLDGDAVLDASGDAGGGSILVGGDWQGANAEVRNARVSWVGHGVSLLSDALLNGDGGKIVVWADEATAFAGSIWARGGREGGNGGQVEVSGKVALLYRGRTDTRAARGRNGELLLDPLAIIIQGGSGDGSNDGSLLFSGGVTPGTITADALGPTVIFESEIEEQSKTTDIILRAQRSVTVGSSAFNYTASGNVAEETTGQLALASNSSLLIETRNLGAGEGGASAGIDLVTGGAHGTTLQITTRGDGDITLQTGYSNGEKVGNQVANILLPVLGTASGSILVRASDGSTVQLLGAGYTSGGSIQIASDTVTGGATLNAAGGTQIIGNYVASSGTLAFQGGASSISGTLTLTGNLGGDAALTLGGLDWRGGRMLAGGAVSLTGAGVIDNSSAYRYLARRLNVSGSLSLENSSGYYLDVEAGGTLHLNAGGALTTGTANGLIYLAAGNGGTAALSADAGAVVDVGGGTTLNLRGDSTTGNLISGVFSLAGDGALLLDSGVITTGADTTISGSGLLRMTSGGALGGSHLLTIASDFEWLGGTMSGTGTTVLSGSTAIDNTSTYKYLNRRLEVTGNLAFGNTSGYYLQVGNGGTLHLGATGSLTTSTGNGLLYLSAGTGGVAAFTAAAGSVIDVADGTLLTLRTDGTAGNRMSGTFGLSGAGALVFDSGVIDVSAATRFAGAGRFRFAGGTIAGAGTLTLDNLFDWAGGTFSGAGVTVVSGNAVIDNTTAYKFVNRRVEVSGDLTFGNSVGYYLQIGDGGTLHLLSGGQLTTAGTSGFIYLAAGAGGLARLTADAGSSIAVSASTLLTVRSDSNAGNQIGGTFALTGAGATYFDSGTFATNAATSFTGAGLLRVGGTTLNLNHATTFDSAFRFENGVLAGSGAVDIGGAFTWAGGTMSGTGTTVLSGNGVIDNTSAYKFLNRRLELEGGLSFGNSNGYYLQIGDGGTLHLTASGQLSTATVNGLIYLAAGAGGTARISADAGSDISTASDTLLTLRSDNNTGNQISGTFGLTGAGELVFDSGLLTTAAATHFTGPGSLRISGSNIAFNHASTVSSALRFSSGTISGSGNLAVSGPFAWAGGTMSGTGTTLLSGSTVVDNTSAYKFVNRRVEVGGTVAFGNSSGYYVQVGNGGTLHLLASGQLATETTNGMIYLAAGSGGTAVLSAAAGADISVADGTALVLRSDSNAGNLISGTFALSGAGSFHFDSGVISANSDTTFTGSGELLISSGATLAGSALVTIASGFDWAGGVMSGTGTTRLVNAVSLTVGGTRTLNRTLEIAAGGSLDIGDNVVIQRSTSSGGTGRIVALGALTKSSGSGTAYLQYLDLQGNLSSSSGILSLYGNAAGTSLGSASFSTSGTGLMRMDSGLFTLTNGQTATVAAGTLDLSGATLSTAGTSSIIGAGTFLLSSGTLDGAGTLNIGSGFNWTAGTMSGAGVTRLVSDVSLTGSGTRTLNRTLEIAAGASLNLGNDVLIQRATSNGGTGGIVALGSLTKSSGTGTAYVRYLDLRGNISSSSGTLSIYGNTAGSSIDGAVFSTTGSGVLSVDSGLLTLNTGESASVAAGIFELSGGTLSTTGDSSFDGAGTLRFTSGTISGIGRLTVNAGFDWSAGTQSGLGVTRLNGESRILSGSTKTLSRTLEVGGRLTASNSSGALQFSGDGRISVLSSGEFVLNNVADINAGGNGRIDNAGLMRKTGTAATTLAMPLTNTGTLRVEEGVLTASSFPVNAGTLDVFSGASLITGGNLQNTGTIQGSGSISVAGGTLTNAGVVRPGGPLAAGTLNITGNFVQTTAGRIEADVLGVSASQQDRVQVSGTMTLGGDLVLSPAAGLSFSAQDRYTALSCNADGCLSGSFANIDTNGLTATATTFSNALSFATGTISSTWTSTASGFWDVAANWAGGLIPTAGNDVVIDQAGDLTVTVRTATSGPFTVNSLFSNENISIVSGGLTLSDDSVINGRLTMSGGTLNIGTELHTGSLAISGGTISGGRLFAAGSSNVMTGGTLNALQLMIGTQFNASGGSLANVTLSRLGSSVGAGQVLIGNNGDLRVAGALTLDNADITLASDNGGTYLRSITGPWSIGGNGSILFGGSHNAVRANNYLGYGSSSYSLSIG